MTILLPLSTFAWQECFYRHDRAHAVVQSGAMDADAAQAMIDRWAALAWLFTGEAMLQPAWQRFTTAAAQSHEGMHPVAVLAKLVAAAMAMEVDRYAAAYGTDPLHPDRKGPRSRRNHRRRPPRAGPSGATPNPARPTPQQRRSPMTTPAVLDACCGSRMFWFDRADGRAIFGDIRREEHMLTDKSSAGGARQLIIQPDIMMDFREIPFPDYTFHLVVFDPPHLVTNGKNGWLAKKYGKLGENWRTDIAGGFSECFRVLKPFGTLVFKWNEHEVKVSEILKLTDQKPLFGNRCGKTAKSHWLVFMKSGEGD